MSEVEQLLLRLGRELGRDAAQMRPIVDHVVLGCWYDTLASLRAIESEAEWAKLNLPSRLLALVQRELSMSHPVSVEAAVPAQAVVQRTVVVEAVEAVVQRPMVLEAAEPGLEDRRSLFLRRFDGVQVEGVAMEVLRRVLTNLVTYPLDPKFRRLNKAKLQTTLLVSDSAREALSLLGFRESSEDPSGVLTLQDSAPVEFARQVLGRLPSFNPYAASFTTAAGAVTVPHAKAAAERQRERQLLQAEAQAASRAVTPEASARVTTVAETLGDFQVGVWPTANNDEDLILDAWRATRSNAGDRNFASREKAELLRRKKEGASPTTCSLRIIFPDKKVLELLHYFRPSDRVQVVIHSIKEKFLLEEAGVSQFSLFLPPKRLDPTLTCEAAGLVPCATIRFNVDAPKGVKGPFLTDT